MKILRRVLCIIFYIISLANIFGQSVTLQPNTFQLPKVSTNPACTVPDKGKVVFNTNQNKILYCNGTAWIDPETGVAARITPAFGVYNISGQTLTNDEETIRLRSESFDLNNNFNLDNAETKPNTIILQDNGIYEIRLNFKVNLIDFVPTSSTKIRIKVLRISPGVTSTNYYYFRIRSSDDENYFDLTKIFKCPAGSEITLAITVDSPPSTGSLEIVDVTLNGHLISWY